MTPAQLRELVLLAKRSAGLEAVDGRSLPILLRKGYVEIFRGDTYSTRRIVGITKAGLIAIEGAKK